MLLAPSSHNIRTSGVDPSNRATALVTEATETRNESGQPAGTC